MFNFYLLQYFSRTDIHHEIEALNIDTLLVTGAKASHIHTVHTMHKALPKATTQLLKIERVGDVIVEAVSKK